MIQILNQNQDIQNQQNQIYNQQVKIPYFRGTAENDRLVHKRKRAEMQNNRIKKPRPAHRNRISNFSNDFPIFREILNFHATAILPDKTTRPRTNQLAPIRKKPTINSHAPILQRQFFHHHPGTKRNQRRPQIQSSQ